MRLWLVFLGLLPILLVGSGPGAGANTPALPPQNGLIAVQGDEGIYLVNPEEGSAIPMAGAEQAEEAAWSPDGTRLAVALWTPDDEMQGIYTMKSDGSERTLVVRNGSSPTWSPDGEWLAFVRTSYSERRGEQGRLVVIRADGTDEHVLVPQADTAKAEAFVSAPAWSPDGKQIAFFGDGGRIQLVSPDGSSQGGFDANPIGSNLSWSPDASRLAFDSHREFKSGSRTVVVVLDLASGKETLLQGEQDGAQAPEWSPEGDQIAFLSVKNQKSKATTSTTTHSCGGDSSVMHLWSMRPDGTKARRLAETSFYGRLSWGRLAESLVTPAPVAGQRPAPAPIAEPQPAPAADEPPAAKETPGPSVASESAPTVAETTARPSVNKGGIAVRGSNGIYLVDPDTAAANKVPGTGAMIAPAWSPDNSLLAVEQVAEKAGPSSIYTIRPDGTNAQLVLENASAPTWSSEGDRIFVVRNECSTPCEPEDDEANVLYSVRPDGSDLQRVDEAETDAYDARELAWRTDGSPISFFDDSANSAGSFDTSAAEWAPDESRMAFIGALGPTDEEASADNVMAGLWIVSADGGAPKLLLKGASGRPSWP